MARGVKRGVGTMPASAGCMSIRSRDVLKAMALGADAVLVGRAVLYGVAAAGRSGASRALGILREEIDRGLALLGAPSVKELGPRFLVRAG